jgi:phenylpropionate dioxygenase-like ring-hydroxylating dioxygenase large terminal subunit
MTTLAGRATLTGRTERPAAEEAYVSKDRYFSREFAELEAERLWPRVWQIVCREEEVADVGDYVEYTICDQSIVIVRDNTDTLRAYFNACLHRGTPLKSGCGNAKEFRCRFHAWRWKFDFDPASIDPQRLQLPACLVDTWGGFVFVNMDHNAQPLHEFLAPFPALMARFEHDKMRLVRNRSTLLPGNWKTMMYAFTEGYHFAAVHPQVLFYTNDTGLYEAFEAHGTFTLKPGSSGRPSPRLGDAGPDNKEILLTWASDISEVLEGFGAEGADFGAVSEVIESLPDDIDPRQFMATFARQFLSADGVDLSQFSDDDLFTDGVPIMVLFPDVVALTNAAATTVFRFRPNGPDPDSCLLDVWNLRRFAEGKEPASVEREYFQTWRDHNAWGRAMTQDFRNIETLQRGMHSRGSQRLIFGRQDLCAWNHNRVLEQYIGS